MNTLEEIARLILAGDALLARESVRALTVMKINLTKLPKPTTCDHRVLALSAGLAELLSSRLSQMPPAWSNDVAGISPPIHLLQSAATMRNLRMMCESEGPASLRHRGFYAPPDFLMFA